MYVSCSQANIATVMLVWEDLLYEADRGSLRLKSIPLGCCLALDKNLCCKRFFNTYSFSLRGSANLRVVKVQKISDAHLGCMVVACWQGASILERFKANLLSVLFEILYWCILLSGDDLGKKRKNITVSLPWTLSSYHVTK